jgi:hypothetical protein
MHYFLAVSNPTNELIVIVVTCNLKCRIDIVLGLLIVMNSLKAFKFDVPSLPKALGLLPVSHLPSLKGGFMLPVYLVSATC